MNGKFKVWNSIHKKIVTDDIFYISQSGDLLMLVHGFDFKLSIQKALPHFIPVFSTGKTDKNGVELFDGDKLKTGHTIMLIDGAWCGSTHGTAGTHLGMKPLNDPEKIGSKYEEN